MKGKMSEKQTFNSLRVWQTAHELAVNVYQLSHEFPKEEVYGMANQIKRAAASVAAHLAEGYGRFYYRDKERLFMNAKGSIAEVQNFLYLAKDLNFLEESRAMELIDAYEGLSHGVGALSAKVAKSKREKAEAKEMVEQASTVVVS